MVDPNDPKQAKKYENSGIIFMISMVLLLLILAYLAVYIFVNKLY